MWGGVNLSGPTALEESDDEEDEPDEEPDEEEEEPEEFELSNFNPDTTFNIELGTKLTRMAGKLTFNGALFHTWWNQIQSDQFSAIGLPIVGNVGNAKNYGIEADVSYRATSNWSVKVNAAWNKSELTSVTDSFGAALGAQQNGRLPGSPTLTLGISTDVQWTVWQSWFATLIAGYSYAGSTNLLFDRENGRDTDPVHLANMRLTFRRENLMLSLLAENIFNSRANSFPFGNPFSLSQIDQITPYRPRTIGIRAGWSF